MAQQVGSQHENAVREMFHKVFHEGDLDSASHYVSEDVEIHLMHKHLNSFEEWKHMANAVLQAFPDVRYELLDFTSEGTRVAFRWEARGTHKGELWGIPASNKQLMWHGLSLFEFDGGKVKRGWTYSNFAEVFGSLGM